MFAPAAVMDITLDMMPDLERSEETGYEILHVLGAKSIHVIHSSVVFRLKAPHLRIHQQDQMMYLLLCLGNYHWKNLMF